MDIIRHYSSVRENAMNTYNIIEFYNLINSSQPYSCKNKRYALRLSNDLPAINRKKVAIKYSTHTRNSAIRTIKQHTVTYDRSSSTHPTKNNPLTYSLLGVTSYNGSGKIYKKLKNMLNKPSSTTQENPIIENKKQYSQSSLPIKHKQKSRQYPFRTTQNLRNTTEQSNKVFQIGKEKLRLNEYEEALAHFDQAYKLNSKNTNALLYKGIALIDMNKPNSAIQVLKELTLKNSKVVKPAYLLLSMAYKRMNDLESALKSLDHALSVDNNHLEAIIARANIYITMQRWSEAILDFKDVLKQTPNTLQALLGIAECEEKRGEVRKAVEAYDNIIRTNINVSKDIYMKKVELEIKIKEYDKALASIESISENSADIILLKGKILEKKGQVGDAALNYEQAAKDTNAQIAAKALFRITKMKLREKDFYEAYFNIERAIKKEPLNSKIVLYKKLIEGIVALIKKGHKEGVDLLTNIEQDISKFKDNIKYIYWVFLAYGYMVQHQFEVILCLINNRKV